ncbi:hypothetical protein HYC85_006355 [Camellia sinensis]|uniref:UBZ4-type domain-containing protein n=1 Tax=Camellia sinensis TaxID=4442 RepID=A0A7J7HLB7_CAMSI|nr:hypothetical protein HYC85_006355 [Camellia sinensis]
MDDMKDKVKGFMKKVNNPFSSSSSAKFKGQGRVLGSSSSDNPNPNPILGRPSQTVDSKPSQPPSSASANSKPSPQRPLNSDQHVTNRSGIRSNSDSNCKPSTGFDPYDPLITSGKRSANGYSLNVFECPVCGRAYGSQEEVSHHVDSCLNSTQANNVAFGSESSENDSVSEGRNELEACVGAYVSGKPFDGSVEIVLKLLRNIVKEPENAKFRRIRMGNPKIREAIGDVTGCVELLECVGFGLVDEDGEMWAAMEIPSEEGMLLIKKAISLLETQKVEELPSAAPSKIDEPVEPKKVDRQVRVFFSVSESVAAKIELPDSVL